MTSSEASVEFILTSDVVSSISFTLADVVVVVAVNRSGAFVTIVVLLSTELLSGDRCKFETGKVTRVTERSIGVLE